MRDIDQIVRDMSIRTSNPIGLVDGSMFVVAMKKMAEAGMPDATGSIEGPFLVPLPQAVDLIAQMISNEFKTQVYYIFYANMLRGLNRGSLAEEFMDHAEHELEHATYLLRRLSVLSPGGISIPPYPSPEPLTDPQEIVQAMIVVEQMGLVLWKQLHSIMGDNPMKYSIEQFLQREEEHQDELWQHVENAPLPEMPTAETMQTQQPEQQEQQEPAPAKTQVKVETSAPQAAEQKVASIFASALRRKQAMEDTFPMPKPSKDNLMASLAIAVKDKNTANAEKLRGQLRTEHGMSFDKKASLMDLVNKKADMMLPTPGADDPEQYFQREQQLSAQQAMAEAAHARTVAQQATQAAQQAQAEAQAAQQSLQQAQQQVEQLGQQSAQESQQSMMATQQAAEAEARAADHSISKMQLGMRVNQMRQTLANFVMQDPVAESAATVSDLAAQGMPATPMQQQQAEQAAAMGMDPNAQPSAETQEQSAEAQNAEQEAQEQGAQAEQSAQKDKGKGEGTHVTVKTSNEMGTVVQRVGAAARGAVGQTAKAAPSGLGALIAKAKPFAPIAAGGAALVGGAAAAHHAGQQKAAGIVDGAGRAAGRGFVEGAAEAVTDKAKKNAPAIGMGLLAAGGLAHAHRSGERSHRRSDIADGVAEGMRRTKTSSPADQRLMQEILGGEQNTLGRSLIDIVKKHAPGAATMHAAAQQAAQAAPETVQQGAAAVRSDLHELGQKVRPHVPGFVAGLGTGILGTKMMSRDQQPAPTPSYYMQ